jgi:AcrR family transcriptional regulator
VAEIKDLAWAQIGESGASSLSLRAIARDMGMTSSALYRYFPSRDHLLGALAKDAFASLADRLEEVEAKIDKRPPDAAKRCADLFHAYRGWALEHPTEYALMYLSPVPGLEGFDPGVKAEMHRGDDVLFRIMTTAIGSSGLQPRPLALHVAKRLRAQFRTWTEHEYVGLPPEAMAACMYAWTQLHGAISLELLRKYPEPLLPADALFDQQLSMMLAAMFSPG